MRSHTFALAVTAVAGLVLRLPAADACSFEPPVVHNLDAGEQARDTVPPAAPVVTLVQFVRNSPGGNGCGEADSCDGSGQVGIVLADGADDFTPAARMGYHLRVRGANPVISAPAEAVRRDAEGTVWLLFSDRDQDINDEIEIVAVDLAGNASTPTTVNLVNDLSGCSSRGASGGVIWLALLGIAGVWATRRRRRTRHH